MAEGGEGVEVGGCGVFGQGFFLIFVSVNCLPLIGLIGVGIMC